MPGAANMVDAIVDDLSNALQEFDARLAEMAGGFGCTARAEESSDSLVGFAAETMGVVVSVSMGALFFHLILVSDTSIVPSARLAAVSSRRAGNNAAAYGCFGATEPDAAEIRVSRGK